MIRALQPMNPKPFKADHRRALQNPAVAHCQRNWDRVYNSVLKYSKSKALARIEASEAYLEAMPLLGGYENICDFIGCVGFGMTSGILNQQAGTKLLYAAQVAFMGSPRTKKPQKAPPQGSKSIGSSPLAPEPPPPAPPTPIR